MGSELYDMFLRPILIAVVAMICVHVGDLIVKFNPLPLRRFLYFLILFEFVFIGSFLVGFFDEYKRGFELFVIDSMTIFIFLVVPFVAALVSVFVSFFIKKQSKIK